MGEKMKKIIHRKPSGLARSTKKLEHREDFERRFCTQVRKQLKNNNKGK